jgi:hypothetical protein
MIDLWSRTLPVFGSLREAMRNCLDACQAYRAAHEGEDYNPHIMWAPDPVYLRERSILKLSITDNGRGIPLDKLAYCFNMVGGSLGVRGKNFGLGMKVGGIKENPAGIVVTSWYDGRVGMIWLLYNKSTDTFGLKRFPVGNGRLDSVLELPRDHPWAVARSHDIITSHGTNIVLLGCEEDAPAWVPTDWGYTWQQVVGSGWRRELGQSRWVARCLNRRFWRLDVPTSVRLDLRDQDLKRRYDYSAYSMRPVHGQKHHMEEDAEKEKFGSVLLPQTNMRVYWYLLPIRAKGKGGSAHYEGSAGHVAILYDDELYSLRRMPGCSHTISQFGLERAKNRFVFYVEPQDYDLYVPDGTRSQIIRRVLGVEQAFPWERVGAEFSQNLPPVLNEFVVEADEEIDAKARDKVCDHPLIKKPLVYVPYAQGTKRTNADIEVELATRTPTSGGDGKPRKPRKPREPGKPRAARVVGHGAIATTVGLTPSPAGQTARGIRHDMWPHTIWKSRANTPPTREKGEMRDLPLHYDRTKNLLYVNEDFRTFVYLRRELKAEFIKRFGEAMRERIDRRLRVAIQNQYRQRFGENIIRILEGFVGHKNWPAPRIEQMLSDEALVPWALGVILESEKIRLAVSSSIGDGRGLLEDSPLDHLTSDEELGAMVDDGEQTDSVSDSQLVPLEEAN